MNTNLFEGNNFVFILFTSSFENFTKSALSDLGKFLVFFHLGTVWEIILLNVSVSVLFYKISNVF